MTQKATKQIRRCQNVAALGQFCLISKQGSGERSIRSSSRFEMLQIASPPQSASAPLPIWRSPFRARREVAFAEDRGDGEFGALEWRRYDRCAHRRSSSAVLPLIPSSSRCSGRRSINSSITSKAPDLACSPNHVKIISGNIGARPE
jgi:hypothetical protein